MGRKVIAAPAKPSVVRCAIYCRKSTEEGLDQEFNSLDAQREAGEAYIKSQEGEGWTALPHRYDDGGYSGGNMDRPEMQRLLADIEAGKIDCVIVYKVDRLSRSLLDFAKIIGVFNDHGASFVAVTQQFNTSTSVGRLMLHILLSFAQFEREMISERTRDKVAAARRKGRWTGGYPILGYDLIPEGRKLVVNDAEAAMVREIFATYLKEQSLLDTAKILNKRGWKTKSWTTKKGRLHGGASFNKVNLFGLLTNAVYIGKVNHKGEVFPGLQTGIVDPEVWQKVQDLLRHNGRTGGKGVRNKYGALLKELLRCVPCGTSMVHSYTVKDKRRYRYYVCSRAQKQGWATCPTKSVPALEVERFVVDQIRAIGKDENLAARTVEQARLQIAEKVKTLEAERNHHEQELRRLNAEVRRVLGTNGSSADRLAELQERIRTVEEKLVQLRTQIAEEAARSVDERDLATALSLFDPVWDALFPKEQARILRLLVEQVGYDGAAGNLAVTFRPGGIKALTQEVGGNGHKG